MVKLLATIPLLSSPLKMPTLENRFFKEEAFVGGKQFLYQNNADTILLRTRLAAATFDHSSRRDRFLRHEGNVWNRRRFYCSDVACVDRNLLAHGALVTTDAALSCFMFASVYAFYRYVKAPSVWRVCVVGIATGLALAAKHTGLLVLPMLLLLSVCEVVRYLIAANHQTMKAFGKHVLKIAGSMVAISLIAVAILWAFYGFRYAARPNGLQLIPPLMAYVQGLKPHEIWLVTTMARFHVLPESYLYGLADVRLTANFYTSYVLGKVYNARVWFHFPIAFLIKSTIRIMALLLLSVVAIAARRLKCWREILIS